MNRASISRHQPSDEHIETALRHSRKAIQQGQRIQQVGQQLLDEDRIDSDLGQEIIDHGSRIEQCARESLHWATTAQNADEPEQSSQAMEQATEAHIRAIKEHTAASKKFTQVFKSYLEQFPLEN
ncbi:MAG: hypothetical protein ACFB8W_01100 [Elainellaceae cyanobacterium]